MLGWFDDTNTNIFLIFLINIIHIPGLKINNYIKYSLDVFALDNELLFFIIREWTVAWHHGI